MTIKIPINFPEKGIRYEKDIQAFTVRAIDLIKVNGEKLKLYRHVDGRPGIEYRVQGAQKRIDILAITNSRRFVCIELKLGKGYDSHIGKLQGYMGRIMAEFGTENVTGILLARHITDGAKYSSLPMGDRIILLEFDIIEEQQHPALVITRVNFASRYDE